MNENYKINKNTIYIEDKKMNFNFDIAQVVKIESLYIVRLEIPQNLEKEETGYDQVYAIDVGGNIVWQIENPIKAYNLNENSQGYMYFAKSIYTYVKYEEKKLYAHTFASMCYIIDPETGKIVGEIEVR